MKHQNQLIIPNQPNKTTKGVFSVLVMAILMLSMSWKANAQITYTFNGGSSEWLNNSNWSPSTASPGSKTVTTNNDIAYFNTNLSAVVGINMNTQAGTHYLGALHFGTSITSSRAVNNSTGTFGTLYFNGANLNGVNNTIIWHQSNANHYFNWSSSQFNLGLNATDHVIQITGGGGLIIASVISGASKNLEKAGPGVLTLQSINTYTGNTTISAGTLALSGTGSIATSPNIIIGSSGRFDVSGLTTALTLASTQTLKASATGGNTTGSIILGTSRNLTLSVGGLTFTALASTTNPALTVSGSGSSSIVLNSSPITVPNNLSVGTYKLIGKSGSATVTGTPGTLSYTGSSNNTSASVALTNGELVLTVITLSAPTVTNTTPATNIATTSATLAGNVTSIGTASISNNGSVYSLTATNAAPQISGIGVTQLATSSPGAGTGTFSNNVSSTLSVNAQYSFNAYAINSVGTSYGTVSTFYTLANVPSAPTVNNPTTSSLDVTINVNSNPSATEFAIQETGGNYLQANGTLSGSAVWQTAATWGTKTVTGLASSTTYTFQVKARNGTNTETTFGTSAGGLASAIPTNNWTGGTGNWNTGSNWSLSRVPLNTDNITISSGSSVMDINHTLTTGRTLTISGTGSLTINPTISLTIAGVADFGGKLVTLQSDATGTAAIGTVAGTLNNASNVSVERYIPRRRAFRFLSSPVNTSNFIAGNWQQATHITGSTSGQNGFDQSNSGTASLFTYNTGTEAWAAIPNTNATNLTIGAGYRMLIRGNRTINLNTTAQDSSDLVMSANGSIVTGNVVFGAGSVSSSPAGIPALNAAIGSGANNSTVGWSLIGNPYASAVNWANVTKSNVSSTFATWNVNNAGRGSYVYHDGANGTGSNASNIINSGQAVFVQTIGANPSITFTEAAKVTSTPPSHFKKSIADVLNIDIFMGDRAYDGLAVMFDENCNNQYDVQDFIKLVNPEINFYSYLADGTKLAMNKMKGIENETIVPLGLNGVFTGGAYELKFSNQNSFANAEVKLKDKFINKIYDLKSINNLVFTVTADSNSWGENRFELIFSKSATGLNNELSSNNNFMVFPNPANNVLNLSLTSTQEDNYSFSIYNQLGAIISKGQLDFNSKRTHALNIENLSNGVYFIQVKNGKGAQTIKFIK